MQYTSYSVKLQIKSIAGGWPGTIDAHRAFLQNPMMAKRVPAEAREEFLAHEREWGAEEDGGSMDIVKTGFRKRGEIPYLGGYQIKAMLQGAARTLYDNTGRPNIYQVARAITYGMEVTPQNIPIDGGSDGGTIEISQIISHPRNPNIRVPSIRQRALWYDGTLTFTLHVIAQGAAGKTLTQEVVRDLLDTGGMFIGLGTDRGYGHGRYTLMEMMITPQGELPDLSNPKRKGMGYVRGSRKLAEAVAKARVVSGEDAGEGAGGWAHGSTGTAT